jgi:hypothetical protein
LLVLPTENSRTLILMAYELPIAMSVPLISTQKVTKTHTE